MQTMLAILESNSCHVLDKVSNTGAGHATTTFLPPGAPPTVWELGFSWLSSCTDVCRAWSWECKDWTSSVASSWDCRSALGTETSRARANRQARTGCWLWRVHIQIPAGGGAHSTCSWNSNRSRGQRRTTRLNRGYLPYQHGAEGSLNEWSNTGTGHATTTFLPPGAPPTVWELGSS